MIVFVVLGVLSFWILFMVVLIVREVRKPMYVSLADPKVMVRQVKAGQVKWEIKFRDQLEEVNKAIRRMEKIGSERRAQTR